VGCYIWYSEEGPGWAAAPPRPLLAVQNATVHPSTASVPITVLLYDGTLLCGFTVPLREGCVLCRHGQHLIVQLWMDFCELFGRERRNY